jgi:acetolactate decarboxylase
VPGYHLHGVSDDRAHGGHVFDLTAARLEVAIHHVSELRLALPETEAFLKAHLGASTEAALDQTEHQG